MTYDYLPEVTLITGEVVELVHFLGERSIIRSENGEEVISSKQIDSVELANYIRSNHDNRHD